ncbi:Bit61p NDAI_0G05780 [Naumovozyma dairenensis CBS 421]|uniref:Uncharacterized protein n=1 Tax=Naumovozyma dairenensis (strain ATCC 10597 / BCRC 20456 / CBS 421 / NBRC 0211 / NRRL Y-12639) TaxID=1071378 RepID=J7S4P1_NAUDC|nr:hypothetical protein NDAI_0G05780 [Naumovozyma dairenensis CBS 421]CCK73561.1 hypothetical protein NDAI_0G05780 [Naumovozyma dairenensis CBS 421]
MNIASIPPSSNSQRNSISAASYENKSIRSYSTNNDIIIPQMLVHDDPVLNDNSQQITVSSPTPLLSHVGFQSIFHGVANKGSISKTNNTNPNTLSSNNSSSTTLSTSPSTSSKNGFKSLSPIEKSQSSTSSSSSSISFLGHNLTRKKSMSIFSLNRNGSTTLKKPDLTKLSPTISSTSSNRSITSTTSGILTKKYDFGKLMNKIFTHNKPFRNQRKVDIEPVLPHSLGKFLHSSFERRKGTSKSLYIHNSRVDHVMDSNHSIYSFNPALPVNDTVSPTQDTNPEYMLQDLLRHLPSLEANYKNFTSEELSILSGNLWYIFCNYIVDFFRDKRLWNSRIKIEDLNNILLFYYKLPNTLNFIWSELNEFLNSSLFIFENEIIFNYSNEYIMNNPLKRLCIIWQKFYQEVYYDILTIFLPFNRIIEQKSKLKNKSKKKGSNGKSNDELCRTYSTDMLLLKCFRDSIVLPYYQNIINSTTETSKTLQLYIFNQEEENSVSQEDKLILLQCFGILSTVYSGDKDQKIVEELLEGVRISI